MIKAIIRNTLRPLGLQLTSLPDHPVKGGRLQFGPYEIKTDNRELIRSYRDFPLTNSVIARVVAAIAKDEPTLSMIDVGANCGDSTAIAKTAHDLPVLCIEPDEHLYGQLQDNLRQFSHITLVRQYLGEQNAVGKFDVTKTGWNNTLVSPTDGATSVIDFKTLDETVRDWTYLNQVRFLKCDTEGFDVRVLHGARKLLTDRQPVVLFEYNRDSMTGCDEDGFRVFDYLRETGYGPVLFYDAYGRFIAAADLGSTELMRDFHDYAEGLKGKVLYYDVLAFAKKDAALAAGFIHAERTFRRGDGQPLNPQ
ncbi:MAG: methyltransferase, FkbM family [Verrucomicrobiaceae bacterium]|nr:methyltransferase, FkbM family [Verrucomicrobiaceae bacterium]